jgi:16S rRNA (guanine1207-N2)-methyltransferase
MHPTSSLILRFLGGESAPQAADILLVNPPRDTLAQELLRSGCGSVNVFTQDFGDHHYFEHSGISSRFGLLPESTELPAAICLFQPREKDRLEFMLHFLAERMPRDGTLWLVGENKAGIKSAETRLRQRFAEVRKLDSARHCVLYQARSNSPGHHPATGSGASPPSLDPVPFSLQDYIQRWTLPGTKGDLQFASLPGSFAHGRLDKGTALLLDFLRSPEGEKLRIQGKVLDFGCGVGVIGLALKQVNPGIDLTMVDSSAGALESTRLSLQANGVDAEVIPADGLGNITGRYDWIISNPPFHQGINADLGTAWQMIARAPSVLGKQGRMLLVCNRHLRYESWIDEAFGARQQVCENREFKVIVCGNAQEQTVVTA